MPKGWNKLKVDLDNLTDEVKSAPYEAMLAGADRVVAHARLLCISARVAATIHRTGIVPSKKKGNPSVRVEAGDASTIVGKKEKFQLARIIEYGTYGRGEGPPQMAQPFMRIAWRTERDKIRREMRAAIRAKIRSLNHGS